MVRYETVERRRRGLMKSERGPPMTFGTAAVTRVRLIVWCKGCRHQVDPDPAEMAARYGSETAVPDWRERLACSRCGRQVDMVVSGTKRPRKFLGVAARRRVVNHRRLIWPGYRDRSRRVVVRRRCRRVGWRLRRGAWRLGRSWLLSKGRRN